MGTTTVCALVKGNDINLVNVGDSRAYVISNDEIRRVTKDHSYVQALIDEGKITEEEAREHPQKNVINLIKSLEQIFDNKLLDKFIIVGIKKNDFYEYLPLKYLEKIEIIEFSTQKEIKNLLQEVYVFVFVSFYESFGIPALEAMKCGVPVIVSNTGALPEILNEQSMTIDPLDIFDGMKKILVKLLDNQEYEKLSRKMFLRSKDFDYMITAHNTNIIYKRVLSKVGNEIE